MNIKESGIVDVKMGENVTVVLPVNIYGSSIGNHNFIGPFVEIQKNTQIGDNNKIQSHSFICLWHPLLDCIFKSSGKIFSEVWISKQAICSNHTLTWIYNCSFHQYGTHCRTCCSCEQIFYWAIRNIQNALIFSMFLFRHVDFFIYSLPSQLLINWIHYTRE